jgi:glycosyltransferase involved in cell wall biosynthesis
MSAISGNKLTTVSIIIPFFNREKFLAEAIESVLAQTYQDWELILIDDGSSDSSSDIVRSFIQKYPEKIFLYAHEDGANRGASASRNLGIKYASGNFITFLDSDDVFLPNTLEVEVAAFGQNLEANAVCGTLQYWFSWTRQQNKKERDFLVNLGLPSGKLYQPPNLLVHNLRAGGRKPGIGCVILKAEFVDQFDLFEDDFRFVCEDQIFWAKVSLYARIYVLNDCLAKYRQHPHSSVSVLMEYGDTAANLRQFSDWLEHYLAENKIENQELWQALKVLRKENSYRLRYQQLMRLYHRMLPYHIRYRIRDLIIRWRTRK